MASCEVCGTNCRGSCKKCGARLCAGCKPKSARAKCKMCYVRRAATTNARTVKPTRSQRPRQAHQQNVTTAYYTPRTRPDFENMKPDKILAFVQDSRTKLETKRQRERNYLDRRAARGTHTPTDEAYEQDQLLELDLLDLLDYIAQEMIEEIEDDG